MPANELIFKKKGSKFSVKITNGMKNNHTPNAYHMKINLENFKDLGLFLQDLKHLHNAKMDKAILHYKELEREQLEYF